MTNEVINLGTLACKYELEAKQHPEGSASRAHLLSIAGRYRDAQYEVLAQEQEYAFADILQEEGIYLDPKQRPIVNNVLQFVALYCAFLIFCVGAVVLVHHLWF